MRVLFVATEMDPFFKVGGLGDVIGSLPIALKKKGLEVSVIIPLYKEINRLEHGINQTGYRSKIVFDDKDHNVSLWETTNQGLEVFFVDNNEYIHSYDKVAIAGDQKEVDHYAFFSRAVTDWLIHTNQVFDIVHLHDWHTGLIPRLCKISSREPIHLPKFVFTIHNLGYHGFSDVDLINRLDLDGVSSYLDDPLFEYDAREDNKLDLLLQGLLSADIITTVSPNYAEEIQTHEYCSGLCEVLRVRSNELKGIVNGIDYDSWDPSNDNALGFNFSAEDEITDLVAAKENNKLILQGALGIKSDRTTPLIGYVGRLDPGQKGLDLLLDGISMLIEGSEFEGRFQFVLLGVQGEPHDWEERFQSFEKNFKELVSVNIAFDENLARLIYGSADLVVIPSRYEPCGLVQLIAMRYGALPIVRSTGGLKDTVEHNRTGFIFDKYDAMEFSNTVAFSLGKYYQDREVFNMMAKKAMTEDFSWTVPAEKYIEIYNNLV